MKIVTVVPLAKGIFKGNLTYFSTRDLTAGSIVSIALRNKKVLGLVTEAKDAGEAKGEIKSLRFNLKKITEVKTHSIFRTEYLDSIFEAAKYFASNKNGAITSLIPAALREQYDLAAKFMPEAKKGEENLSIKIRPEKLLFQAPLEERISYYKTLIRGAFAQKKSIFIVVPGDGDLKTLSELLGKGIEQFTFPLGGGVSPKKSMALFEKIISTGHPVLILGTAPYLSLPRIDLGIIILEHESSNGYKMIGRPHIDLRTFAELFATKINAKLILGDTLLRFETIGRKEADGFHEIGNLSFRTGFEGEISTPSRGDKFEVLTEEAVKEIHKELNKKKNVFIFSLRKGLATMTICRDCRAVLHCSACGAPAVLYLSRDGKKRMFACNRCHTSMPADSICRTCGSWNLFPLGIGTDTVAEEVKKLFPKNRVFKLDKESVRTAAQAEKMIKEFGEEKSAILVGTEMAFSYFKNKIPLSVIASFDSLWSIPSFKMSERVVQILISIINATDRKLIIQTRNKNDPAILSVTRENLLPFVREELGERKNLGYPPFRRFIKITHLGDKNETLTAKKDLQEIFKNYAPEIFSGFVAKVKNKYVTNALLRLDPKKWSLPALSPDSSIDEVLLGKLLTLPPAFNVFVDPEDLL